MVLRDAVPDEHAPVTAESRARLEVAAAARELSDFARAFVPIWPGSIRKDAATPDLLADVVEEAARLVGYAQTVLESMLTYAAVCGATWDVIGEGLGTTRQYANKKYSETVREFQDAVATMDADTEDDRRFRSRYPAASQPTVWGPRLDAWMEQHREPTEVVPPAPAVSGGLVRLGPLAELIQVDGQRADLLNEHLVPPAEKLLPLAERRLQLLRQLSEAGHDLAADITQLEKQIADLRTTAPATVKERS